ncbi:3-hydroxyacyl-CoA dehydrogenase NAD-binding domain-containing protein [Tsuneonella sp. HG222]
MADSSASGPIRKVCVIGSGVMGSGIAAQVANAGVPVLLLDIVPREGDNRNAVAEGAVARMLKTEPAPFMSKGAAKLVETGNIEDHLGKVAECDWIVEAVLERLDVKQGLYAKIEEHRRPGTPVSSNTSSIPLAMLTEGRSDDFASSFMITHFFNPPRYMKLIELVAGEKTSNDVTKRVMNFVDRTLGKSVVWAKDTPGFIANRIGTFWIQTGVNEAFDRGVSVEEADAVVGKPMGVPKTGIFGLVDLVGIDLQPHLMASLQSTLPKDDPYQAIARSEPLIEKMIADGLTGRKGKGGFFRMTKDGGKRTLEAINLTTGHYDVAKSVSLPRGNLKQLVEMPGKLGEYAWAVLGNTVAYAAGLVPEIADSIVGVDDAMKLGYNWKYGPFEWIDQLGADYVAQRLEKDGKPVPELLRLASGRTFYRVEGGKRQYLGTDGEYHDIVRPEGVLLLADVKLAGKPIMKNGSAALWDLGDGVACLEFTGKMNALDDQVMTLVGQAIGHVAKTMKALVIYNEGAHFSAGANLGLALFAYNIGAFSQIEQLVAGGQMALKGLKYAPFPVVGAPHGMALGGGCEILLHCDAIQTHAELYTGLVEVGVGLIPGWGGNGEMLDRWRSMPKMPKGPMPAVAKVFETVSTATVSKSAANAKELGYLRPSDGVTMNFDRLLHDAKEKALAMVDGYAAPQPPEFTLPGPGGKAALMLAVDGFHNRGLATDYDVVVSEALTTVLTGGDDGDPVQPVTENELLAIERREFMARLHDDRTLARIEHMLETGKPLRN